MTEPTVNFPVMSADLPTVNFPVMSADFHLIGDGSMATAGDLSIGWSKDADMLAANCSAFYTYYKDLDSYYADMITEGCAKLDGYTIQAWMTGDEGDIMDGWCVATWGEDGTEWGAVCGTSEDATYWTSTVANVTGDNVALFVTDGSADWEAMEDGSYAAWTFAGEAHVAEGAWVQGFWKGEISSEIGTWDRMGEKMQVAAMGSVTLAAGAILVSALTMF